MHVDERCLTGALSAALGTDDISWFAARQPGIVGFLEHRHGGEADALAVGLAAAWRLARAFEQRAGVPPGRVPRSLLERAELALLAEASARDTGGCAERQPALCQWIGAYMADPPRPLGAAACGRIAFSLFAVVYALDEITSGHEIP